ncbi:3-bisphosphoglycerate-dependent phosphoglycerate mutase [Seminavis robusta]|uniref:phosphoglycerate mutase (2,3-diphosphoglycerate-dependent) n=1 Tax=Seminavis robusta TaxID=568900 RepID=A0A9N8EXI4_9STRA|nr:3-bisphosphoglycerate-dependent phosphoglycerate mutase [Seminavis robusta]|eukprot:Sro2354_g324500.1 3-bisphosphoglycerate-dependent phosphoglycerate mutase (407) ;mRNA; r:4653-5873
MVGRMDLRVFVLLVVLLGGCHGWSHNHFDATPSHKSPSNQFPIHTLILCRHGDSIWNGGEPGCQETFTGWSDVPLSQKGIKEAKATGEQLSALYSLGIDVCCTSILSRAQLTAHYCLWGFAEKPNHEQPRQYVTDYRLNERHYGALQGFVKQDVENGIYGHDPKQVRDWRRAWYAIPPLLQDEDPQRIQEIQKFQHFCDGPENVPRGESLAMVATDRIQPFLDERLTPLLNQAALRKQQLCVDSSSSEHAGGTGLVVAHANSLRALIGILCRVEENPSALQKLEAMKIPTGVPLVLKYQQTDDQPGKYRVLDALADYTDGLATTINEIPTSFQNNDADLPVRPLSCLPFGGGTPTVLATAAASPLSPTYPLTTKNYKESADSKKTKALTAGVDQKKVLEDQSMPVQ